MRKRKWNGNKRIVWREKGKDGKCKVKKQKADVMMLENRTLEEWETRRLGKSYETGIKTTLSPHHATAFFSL